MTRQAFFDICLAEYGTEPDYPFDGDFETAVLRHEQSRKWYAIVMRVSRRKFGLEGDERVEVVNLKRPVELMDAFGQEDGVYPAYHMNKAHWVSVLLSDVPREVLTLLLRASYASTQGKKKK